VGRFFTGFLFASLLWGGAAVVYFSGVFESQPEVAAAPPPDAGVEAEEERPRRRKRGSRRSRRRTKVVPTGDAVTGDDLREDLPQEIDLGASGGDERLSSSQIDAAFGQAMGRVRRCVLLAPEEAEVRGRVTFGMRIRPNGQVSAVRLSGPAVLTTGEAGSCMRRAARAVRFPSFDGQEMVVRYPVTFE
jgi:hypothetical protein